MMEKKFLEGEIRVQVAEEKGCRKVISVEITPERFKGERSRVLKEMVKEVALPGFRKGKVPVDIVEKRFSDEIRSEAIRSILPLAYEHVIVENGLEPVGDPEFRDVKALGDDPLSFTVCVEVFPRFEIGEYRGIKVEGEEPVVTDEEVEEVIGNLQERVGRFYQGRSSCGRGGRGDARFHPDRERRNGGREEPREQLSGAARLGADISRIRRGDSGQAHRGVGKGRRRLSGGLQTRTARGQEDRVRIHRE